MAYIGGVNFSDHNFAWSDLMVRIARPEVADHLAADFPSTVAASARAWRVRFDDLELHGLDGRSNGEAFASLLSHLDGATEQIVVVSPYLSFPFTDGLVRARRRGVHVIVVTPEANNKPVLRDYIAGLARRRGFQLVRTPQMSHVKAVVIDGAKVMLGSSNFDVVSYEAEAEIVGVFDDRELAGALQRRLIAPAYAGRSDDAPAGSALGGLMATTALRCAQGYIRILKLLRGRR